MYGTVAQKRLGPWEANGGALLEKAETNLLGGEEYLIKLLGIRRQATAL